MNVKTNNLTILEKYHAFVNHRCPNCMGLNFRAYEKGKFLQCQNCKAVLQSYVRNSRQHRLSNFLMVLTMIFLLLKFMNVFFKSDKEHYLRDVWIGAIFGLLVVIIGFFFDQRSKGLKKR